MNTHISKRLRFSLVAALLLACVYLLSSCSTYSLTRAEKANMKYWRQADRYVGKDVRWSDAWCEVAHWDRGKIVLERSSDSNWELSDKDFDRDTTITRIVYIDGVRLTPTTYYRILK